MLQTSSLLMLWLAACTLVPAHLASWATSTLQDAHMVATALPVPAPPLPKAVQVTALRVSDLDRHGIVKFFSAKP
jgi:hypothetical protein